MQTDVRRHYRFAPDQVVISPVVQSPGLDCHVACFEPGQSIPQRADDCRATLFYVLEGTGLFTLGGGQESVSAGGLAIAEPGLLHGIVNPGPGRLVVLAVTAGGEPETGRDTVFSEGKPCPS